MNSDLIKKIAFSLLGLILIIILCFNIFVTINSYEKGILITFGKINEKPLNQGLNLKLPFIQNVEKIDLRPISIYKKIKVDSDGIITKDNQTIGVDITLFYKYNEETLIRMYKDFGVSKLESIINNSILESSKVIIGDYDIFSVSMKQEEIRDLILKNLKLKLNEYPFSLVDLKVTNYDWSDNFDKQIEMTMQEAQKVKQKEQELKTTEYETQKLVKQAEAEKESSIQKAQGELEAARLKADAKKLEGEGIRKYNESIRATIDIELKLKQLEIEKIKAEKWNGAYVPNNNYMPIPFNYGTVQR